MTEAGRQVIRWLVCTSAAAGSGILMAGGFAPWESTSTPWGALIPLLLLAWYRPPREVFCWGLLSGLIAWLTGLFWLTALHRTALLPLAVIIPGWIALSLYCALYTAAFAWAVARWIRWTGTASLWRNAASVVVIPALWCGLEYWRGVLFTGFPWNPLGATMAGNPAISQIAEIGGVYLVSAVVVLFNTSIAFTLARYVDWRNMKPYRPHVELFMGLTLMAACTVWGRARYAEFGSQSGNLLVGIVQPAVQQNIKWDAAFATEVQDRLEKLTADAAETGIVLGRKRPDLIIWPETSTPGDLNQPGYFAQVKRLAAPYGPLLLGSMYESGRRYYNSSLLMDTNGTVVARYDKQHLVPFGEFLPFDKWIPALQNLSPLGLSLNEGLVPTVFTVPETQARFSVTICFEDIFPYLSRQFVREGARLLINQSNDAWFDGTAQHRQHLNLSVMRCIENRVPGVRVSNSGASGYIEANGRVYRTGFAESDDGWLGLPGALADGERLSDVALVNVPGAGSGGTVFTRWGDAVWAIPCAAATAIWFLAVAWMDRKTIKGEAA
jgi:apolipoprotein N-acyltransferase